MERIAPEERLLNLIIALTHTRTRMTREQIRAMVNGYDAGTRGENPQADAAFDRMFERDKEELRRMGVPLQTITDSAHGNDIGYRIDASAASMGTVDLDAAELAVLTLAVDYWRGAALGADARQAVTKVSSGVAHEPPIELPFGARPTAARDALGVLAEGIAERRPVRFEYASATAAPRVRLVQPWRLVLRGPHAYLVGFDAERVASRTFRIGRILGAVKLVGEPGSFDIPDDVPLGALAPDAPRHTALVAVRPETAHALRRRAVSTKSEGDWDVLEVPYTYLDTVVNDVLALGGAARAIDPGELAEAVLDAATAALLVPGAPQAEQSAPAESPTELPAAEGPSEADRNEAPDSSEEADHG